MEIKVALESQKETTGVALKVGAGERSREVEGGCEVGIAGVESVEGGGVGRGVDLHVLLSLVAVSEA